MAGALLIDRRRSARAKTTLATGSEGSQSSPVRRRKIEALTETAKKGGAIPGSRDVYGHEFLNFR
jgi:hypothetical protein